MKFFFLKILFNNWEQKRARKPRGTKMEEESLEKYSYKRNQTRIRGAHLSKNASSFIARPTNMNNEPLDKATKFHENLPNYIIVFPWGFRRLGELEHNIGKIKFENGVECTQCEAAAIKKPSQIARISISMVEPALTGFEK